VVRPPGPVPIDPVNAPDDLVLVAAAQRDPALFGALYDRYVTAVYGYCASRLESKEAAEDATSQVFTCAFAALPRFQADGGSFRSWLFTIAHHTIVDVLRARRPQASLEAHPQLPARDPDPERQALDRVVAHDLHVLVGQLPTAQARIVELRLAGLTDREIAQVVGCSYGAVRVAQYRAVRHLRELLGIGTEGIDHD
jgi:RNA polymerase sigma factor (sigma-70 family)